MLKTLFMALVVVLLGSLTMAQTKIESKWHCGKATAEHKVDAGDMPGHSYVSASGTCTATSSSKAFPEKSGSFAEMREDWKDKSAGKGTYITTLDNGDKVTYSYELTAGAKNATDKWKIVGGTGKQAGVTGSGTCMGTFNADGSSDWSCTGTVSMAKAAAAPAKK